MVFICHGYGGHFQFDYFQPRAPGECHDAWESSVPELLVNMGFIVLSVDHQGHGRSDGLRCYFDNYDDLPNEANAFVRYYLDGHPQYSTLPLFVLGLSMGGCTALRMTQLSPGTFKGLVLLAPMLSLEMVARQRILCCITNNHLKPISGLLSRNFPTMPIAKAARNTMRPLSQKEMDEDPLTWSGDCRARVGAEFLRVTDELMGGGLQDVTTPFITMHSQKDTFTDPLGSERLMSLATVQDKTYSKIGPGLDIDADMWHAISFEPGKEKVLAAIREWLAARA